MKHLVPIAYVIIEFRVLSATNVKGKLLSMANNLFYLNWMLYSFYLDIFRIL